MQYKTISFTSQYTKRHIIILIVHYNMPLLLINNGPFRFGYEENRRKLYIKERKKEMMEGEKERNEGEREKERN